MIDTSQMIYRLENSVNRLLQITKMTGIFSGSVGTSFFGTWKLIMNGTYFCKSWKSFSIVCENS
jgi:hypothetical protein